MKHLMKVAIFLTGAIFIAFGYLLLVNREENAYRQQALPMIKAIEAFKTKNNRLPRDLVELGMVETVQGPFYEKTDSNKYIVYFNIGFDHQRVYRSETQDWVDQP